MKNFVQRSITGFIFVLVVLASILFSAYTFGLLFLFFSGLALIEFHRLVEIKLDVQFESWLAVLMAAVLFVSMFAFSANWVDYTVFAVYFVLLCIVFIAELYRKKENPILNWASFTLGQTYIALPFAMLTIIAFIQGTYNPIFLLAFFITIWAYDSGAYLVGIAIGKHRLFERISPKKSWEGFFGGLVFACATAIVFSRFEPGLSVNKWIGFALVNAIFATFGDLSESLFKRTIGVKESGTFFPGHGGILDRFDSILFSTIAISIYLHLTL